MHNSCVRENCFRSLDVQGWSCSEPRIRILQVVPPPKQFLKSSQILNTKFNANLESTFVSLIFDFFFFSRLMNNIQQRWKGILSVRIKVKQEFFEKSGKKTHRLENGFGYDAKKKKCKRKAKCVVSQADISEIFSNGK